MSDMKTSEKNFDITENIRSATQDAYGIYPALNQMDTENLVKVSQVDNTTILSHTVDIPGIPTNTAIRFEILKDPRGPHYNVIGHHNKLQYIRRTDNLEVALQHYCLTVNEIVKYCFEPPPTLNALWP